MLNYNEITLHKLIVLEKEPYEVLFSHIFRKQQRKPVNQAKIKNLITGKVIEKSFHQSDAVEEADIITEKIVYIYNAKGEYWFRDVNDKSERFSLNKSIVGEQGKFLKENTEVSALIFNEKIIGIKIPLKIDLKVIEAPPSIKGNTAQGGTKPVVLETGATLNTPLFINEGDTVRVNTETGEYSERVS
jgi:elongation factor P